MSVEISPQSRIQVLDNAPVAPGTCILCGSAGGDGRKFVDFNMTVDWIGAIYFCTECFGEAARLVGWIPVAEYNELLDLYKRSTGIYEISVTSNRKIKDGLSLIFAELGREPESVDDYIRNLMASVEESSESNGDGQMDDGRESETNESANVEGSDDLFDATDFDDVE